MTTIDDEWWEQFCSGRLHGQTSARKSRDEPPRSYFSSPATHVRLMDTAERNDPTFGFEVGWLAGYFEEQSRQH
jgi:hypothetical protein